VPVPRAIIVKPMSRAHAIHAAPVAMKPAALPCRRATSATLRIAASIRGSSTAAGMTMKGALVPAMDLVADIVALVVALCRAKGRAAPATGCPARTSPWIAWAGVVVS